MLNISIIGLASVFSSISPLSVSNTNSYSKFTVSNSYFSNSLNTLFFFNIFEGQTKFSKTTFNNILNGAIRVENSADFDSMEITTRLRLVVASSHPYSFEKCMFRNCYAKGETSHGGAVSVHVSPSISSDIDLSFSECSFYNCYISGGHGGAIYGFRIGDISLTRTCFNKCLTRESQQTGDTGMGQACFIWHRTQLDFTKADYSSFSECPEKLAMYPNTESVLSILSGHVDIDNCNFTQNWVEKVASAICLTEQKMCNIDYTNCINCTGESTIYLSGFEDSGTISCDINTINFINCKNYSTKTTIAAGVIVGLYTTITLDDCAFILNGNKYLTASSRPDDTMTSFTFRNCKFDMQKYELVDASKCTFESTCEFGKQPSTNNMKYFNSQECWEIDSPRSQPSSAYALFIVFAAFAAILGFGLYLHITTTFCDAGISNTQNTEKINGATYDAIPE